MTLAEFEELPGAEQYRLTIAQGVHVASRKNECFEMSLYRMQNFYVETKRRNSDGEVYISPIQHEVLLTPYLEQIDISGLLS